MECSASSEALFAHPHKRLERMVSFSDGVFAIAITLLAFELKIPVFHGPFSWSALDGIAPNLIACATSYTIIGLSWWAHTKICRRLVGVNGKLVALNLLRLFFITIIPLPTSVLMQHGGSPDSWVFYALTMAVSGGTEVWMWLYASRCPELIGVMAKRERLEVTLRLMMGPVGFVVSALAARFISFDAGWITVSVLFGPVQWVGARLVRRASALGTPD